jgi:hypothetical protein
MVVSDLEQRELDLKFKVDMVLKTRRYENSKSLVGIRRLIKGGGYLNIWSPFPMALKMYSGRSVHRSRLVTRSTIIVRDNPAFQPAMGPYVSICAADNLDRDKAWMASCLPDHTTCGRSIANAQRPTRVLEVTPGAVMLRRRTDDIPHFKYLTVSHMWGLNPSR